MLRRQDVETRPVVRHGAYGMTLTGGRPCTVARVRSGGVAFGAGLRSGDVICKINGHCVLTASTDSVARILRYINNNNNDNEPLEVQFLFQRISVLIQRFNSVFFHETFPVEYYTDT